LQREKLKRTLLKFNTPRRIIQFVSFIIFSVAIFNLGTLPLVLPVLWTWGLQQNNVGDALTAIQLMFYNAVFPWLALASFLLVGMLVGKSLCGWVCPFGFIQDIINLIKVRKKDFSLRTHEDLLWTKYLVLGITLFISITFSATKISGMSGGYESALGVFAKVPFTALSPSETLFATLPRMVQNFTATVTEKSVLDALGGVTSIPLLFWVQLVIMGAVLVFSAYFPKGWCKYFCPHGAFMAIMNRFSFLGLRRDPVKCAKGGCRLCVEACPMRVPILNLPWEKFSDPECIYCMKCADACENKAIRPTWP
jgi:ferredoxin-type protein NapH